MKLYDELIWLDEKRMDRLEYLKNIAISTVFLSLMAGILTLHFILLEQSYYPSLVSVPLTILLVIFTAYLILRVYYFAYARLNDFVKAPKPVIYIVLLVLVLMPYHTGFLILLLAPSRKKDGN